MPKPRLGQHFLIDMSVLHKTLVAAELAPEDGVIEVGPGKGILTKQLVKLAGRVIALELDERLANGMHERLGHIANLEIRKADARYVSWPELSGELFSHGMQRIKLVANLPYYLATQMVLHALAPETNIATLVIMVQYEVAQRMLAQPGEKNYSSFSVAIQYLGLPRQIVKIPPSAFRPAPRVASAVVRIDRHPQPPIALQDPGAFFWLVREMFKHRRKTLRKCLIGSRSPITQEQWDAVLSEAGIDSQLRPESLSLPHFAHLTTSLLKHVPNFSSFLPPTSDLAE
jgi:16S rRNA (adenine1518-N6/adenine1519-N6)-dimethyltransferase